MSGLLPVALDLRRVSVALVGGGARAERRLRLLDEAGALRVRVFAAQPDQALAARAGDRLLRRRPVQADFQRAGLVFIADLPDSEAIELADAAREARALVNVEDAPEDCDFQSGSAVRRGDLTFGIWTNGRVPMLARVLREWLDRLLPKDFGRVVERLAQERRRLRAFGSSTLALELSAKLAVARLGQDLNRRPPIPTNRNDHPSNRTH